MRRVFIQAMLNSAWSKAQAKAFYPDDVERGVRAVPVDGACEGAEDNCPLRMTPGEMERTTSQNSRVGIVTTTTDALPLPLL